MLRWILDLFPTKPVSFPLSKEENRQADECKQRTLNILNDALKKKDRLLVDDPNKFGEEKKLGLIPLISTDLVKDLIGQLQKVTFKRNKDPVKELTTIAYVYPTNMDGTVYLCKKFFEEHEFLRLNSRPETLIHEVSHLLGYGHTIMENKERLKTSQQSKLCPVSVRGIEMAFSLDMNHNGSYINGSYSCCGETSRDTLCEKSIMAYYIRNRRRMRDTPSNVEELPDFHDEMRILSGRSYLKTLGCPGNLLLEDIILLSIVGDFLATINSIDPTLPLEGAVPGRLKIPLPAIASHKEGV